MGLAALAGRTFPPTRPVEVTRDRLVEFSRSIGGSYDGGPAPVTFPIVTAFSAIRALIDDPGVGLTLARIVHGEQRFSYHRPVLPGDVLVAQLSVESVRHIGGADFVRTVTEIRDETGQQVVTAWATLIHRSPQEGSSAISLAAGNGSAEPPGREPR